MSTLGEVLKERVREGTLYQKLPDNKVRCYACAHRCLIFDGRPGICNVRFNEGGKLYVPWGYVGALQLDPVEKKPFFHALPGAKALSFGMLGCDYRCSYCFPADTRLTTSAGMLPVEELIRRWEDGEKSLEVYTHTGARQAIRRTFERQYQGTLFSIQPSGFPTLSCTPEHEFLATRKPVGGRHLTPPLFLPASCLSTAYCLAVPRAYRFSEEVVLDVPDALKNLGRAHRSWRKISKEELEFIQDLTLEGIPSRIIGEVMGKSPSHVRHLRSKLARGIWRLESLGVFPSSLRMGAGKVRFSREQGGIPAHLPLDERLARLLGYYAAEGCVVRSANRVNAAVLTLAFGLHERHLAEESVRLFQEVFGIRARLVQRPTTLGVCVNKASVGLLFEALVGASSREKRAPEALFRVRKEVVEAFLDAYVTGDGWKDRAGRTTVSTVSQELAWGVAWLVLKCGHLPRFYSYRQKTTRKIQDRPIRQAGRVYVVRWGPWGRRKPRLWSDKDFYYVPIRKITSRDFEGAVYNVEVEEDHSYIAHFVASHNCQNWVTSQALRDPVAGAPPQDVTPLQFVDLAIKGEAKIVTSTYNEPLITSEWAVAVFQEAKRRGLVTSYVSNGNATPEVLDYIRPWVDLYKVDLKGFSDAHYRRTMGGVLQHVLDSIGWIWERKFWLEIVTLIVPGFNDSEDELSQIAKFLVGISPDIPWHVTAFHKDYKMTDPENTSAKTLIRAAEIGLGAGLRYVYAGNLPGLVGPYEHTYCPSCKTAVIERYGFKVLANRLRDGACPKCGAAIPGFWKI